MSAALGVAPLRSVRSTLVVAGTLLLFAAVGFAPSAFVEGDDAALASGALDGRFAYAPVFQPGTNVLTGYLCRRSGWAPGHVLTGICAVSLVLFLVAGAGFVSRRTGVSTAWSLLILALMPETLSVAYFGNGTLPALGVTTMGLACLSAPCALSPLKEALVGGLFGIAAWLRLDALLAWPAMILLRPVPKKRFHTLLMPGVAVLTYLGLATASGITFQRLASYVSGVVDRPPRGGLIDSFLIWWAFFPVSLVLLAFVACAAAWRRPLRANLVPILACFLGSALPWVGTLTSPKHLLFCTPFFAVLVALGAQQLARLAWRWYGAVAMVVIGVAALQYPVGLRADSGLFSAALEPTLIEVPVGFSYTGPLTGTKRRVSLVLGPSGLLETADSWRPLSGLLYGPATWHHRKIFDAALWEAVFQRVSEPCPFRSFVTDSWLASQLAQNALLSRGCVTETPLLTAVGRATWRCGQEEVQLVAEAPAAALTGQAIDAMLPQPGPALLLARTKTGPGPLWHTAFAVRDPGLPLCLWWRADRASATEGNHPSAPRN